MMFNTALVRFVICIITLSLCSCINEDLSDCDVNVSLTYTYNLSDTDNFGQEVDKATLYIFDRDGILVSIHPTSFGNTNNHNQISLERLKQDEYKFVAIAQSTNINNEMSDFRIPELIIGKSTIDDLSYQMKTTTGTQQNELNSFLTSNKNIEYTGQSDLQMSFKKVTKNLHIILEPIADNIKLEPANFDVTIKDSIGNGHVNYDFSLLADAPVTYKPYQFLNSDNIAKSSNGAIIADISTSRLLVEHDPTLKVVDLQDGVSVIDKSLIKLLELLQKKSGYTQWGLQEYLDRLDNVEIRIPFNTNTGAIATIIYINGWVINLSEIEL